MSSFTWIDAAASCNHCVGRLWSAKERRENSPDGCLQTCCRTTGLTWWMRMKLQFSQSGLSQPDWGCKENNGAHDGKLFRRKSFGFNYFHASRDNLYGIGWHQFQRINVKGPQNVPVHIGAVLWHLFLYICINDDKNKNFYQKVGPQTRN